MSDPTAEPHQPAWLNGASATNDDGWWCVHSSRGEVHLGTVPGGTRVSIDVARNSAVSADGVHPSAQLRLSGETSNLVRVNAAFTVVEANQRSSLRLSTAGPAVLVYQSHRVSIHPGESGRGVTVSGTAASLTIEKASSITGIVSDGDVSLRACPASLEIEVEGTLSAAPLNGGTLSTTLIGRVGRLRGSLDLSPGSDLDVGEVDIAGGISGSVLRAESAILCVRRVEGSTLTVLSPADGALAVAVGRDRSEPPHLGDDSRLVAPKREHRRSAISDTSIEVIGNGHIVAGDARSSSASTGGRIVLESCTGASTLLDGDQVVIGGDAAAADGMIEIRARVILVGGTAERVSTTTAANVVVVGSSVGCDFFAVGGRVVCGGTASRCSLEAATIEVGDVDRSTVVAETCAVVRSATQTAISTAGGQVESSDEVIRWTRGADLQVAHAAEVNADAGGGLLTLADCSTLSLSDHATVDLKISGPVVTNPSIGTLTASLGARSSLTVGSPANVTMAAVGEAASVIVRRRVTLRSAAESPDLSIESNGERVVVVSDLGSVTFLGEGDLVIAENSSVADLVTKGASISVEQGSRIARLRGTFRARAIGGHLRGDDRDPPKLVGFEWPEDDRIQSHGSMTSIDVSEVDFGSLSRIRDLRVFDPVPRKLIARAKEVARNHDPAGEDRFALRDTAQWFDELASVTESHSLDGNARSAVEWGRQRLHHRRLKRSSPESLVRTLHRFVGYGYRPVPALGFLVAITVAISSMAFTSDCEQIVGRHDGASASQYCVASGGDGLAHDWGTAWLSVVIAPAKVAKLTDSSSPLPYFPPPIDTLANIGLALSFLFAILALRNYLRVNPLA